VEVVDDDCVVVDPVGYCDGPIDPNEWCTGPLERAFRDRMRAITDARAMVDNK